LERGLMLALAEARARILAAMRPVGAETVPLPAGWGRVLAAALRARLTQPPADVSAMDGYAVRAADAVAGTTLRVIGAAPAGHPFAGTLGEGEAVRIFTGGLVPAGADGLLLQEDAEAAGALVTVRESVSPGRWIRRQGLDFAANEELLPAGRKLSARDIGLAAAANHPWLCVRRRPRIALLATGDEIALPGEPLPPGGIVSSNAHALAALVLAGGGEPTVLPIVADDEAAILAAAEAARGADLIVTTGGASVGEHDLIQKALGSQDFELGFWKIAMRPGKPLIWGRFGQTPVLGLPGNPVSALICGVQFLLPALAALQGLPAGAPPTRPARAGRALPANDKRYDHLRAALATGLDGTLVATPAPLQDSSMVATLARAEALILREALAPAVPEGAAVEVVVLAELGV
jgi:molybdopterin molybdotransferase